MGIVILHRASAHFIGIRPGSGRDQAGSRKWELAFRARLPSFSTGIRSGSSRDQAPQPFIPCGASLHFSRDPVGITPGSSLEARGAARHVIFSRDPGGIRPGSSPRATNSVWGFLTFKPGSGRDHTGIRPRGLSNALRDAGFRS